MAQSKKILICGGTGFIGRNIVESLSTQAEYEVVATYFGTVPIDIPNVEWIKVDLRFPQKIPDLLEDVDIVIQAAATTSGAKDIVNKPYMHVTDNAVMNSWLFRYIAESDVKHVIFFSCTVMYPSSEFPLKEKDLDLNEEIIDKYFGVAWTKLYLEKMCEFYSKLGNTKYTVLRHTNIYGPHDKFDRENSHVCAAMVSKVINSRNSEINVWGNGEEKRDLLYIDDLISAVKLSIMKQNDSFKIYNIASECEISINDLICTIIKLTGRTGMSLRHESDRPTIKTSPRLDSQLVKEELGWTSQYSLEEGLERTISWYKHSKEKV